jgi:Coenzyme PQQ synthesis protein D (PqqD)
MYNFNIDAVPRLRPNCKWRAYLKGIVIEPEIALNETAAVIFRLIDGKKSLIEISLEASKHYQNITVAKVLEDAMALIERLKEEEIVTFV